jgi:hypothetical protein
MRPDYMYWLGAIRTQYFRDPPVFVPAAGTTLGAVSVESGAYIKNVKAWSNDRIELRNIVGESGSEYRAHCIYDLLLFLGPSIHISSQQRHNG